MTAQTPRVRSIAAAILLLGAIGLQAQTAPAPARLSTDDLMMWVRKLSSPEFEGRRSGTQGNIKARAIIANQLHTLGLAPLGDSPDTYIRAFKLAERNAAPETTTPITDENRGANVVGLCRGSGAANAPAMVISAHYDHLGVRNGAMYPGADDNASGVSVALALAKQCAAKPWTHDAVFALLDAEERGLQGARAFLANPPIPRVRIALDINLDMVSRNDKHELYVAGTAQHPELKPVLEPIAARAAIKLLFGHDKPLPSAGPTYDWTMQSDHGVFQQAGIPFVYFGVEDHADYHQPSDTADKIDPSFYRLAAETILDSVDALDRWLSSRQ